MATDGLFKKHFVITNSK